MPQILAFDNVVTYSNVENLLKMYNSELNFSLDEWFKFFILLCEFSLYKS